MVWAALIMNRAYRWRVTNRRVAESVMIL